MIEWLIANKEEIGLVTLGVVGGAVFALRKIAPLTKTKKDDKALKWAERALAALGRWVSPKDAE